MYTNTLTWFRTSFYRKSNVLAKHKCGIQILNRIKLTRWTICALRILNPHRWSWNSSKLYAKNFYTNRSKATKQKASETFDYTTNVDRLRMVSWSNYIIKFCVVDKIVERTFPLPATPVQSKEQALKFLKIILLIETINQLQAQAEGSLDSSPCKW